jgi:carnitine 3-dehydrogenase
MGTFLIYRLAGGEAGMRHFLAQFGPALKLPWTKLEAPELTQELIDRVATQSDDQAQGVPIRELERLRDDCLVAVLGGLRAQDYGAGAVLKAHEQRLFDRLAAAERTSEPAAKPDEPLHLFRRTVPAEWIDYNGHMTESRYLQCFCDTTDALLRLIGVDSAYLAKGHSYYTAETHLMHLGEAKLGSEIEVETQILSADDKRLHLFHSLQRTTDKRVLATAEQMMLHVDTSVGRTVAAEGAVLAAVRRLAAAHSGLVPPGAAGRRVGAARR